MNYTFENPRIREMADRIHRLSQDLMLIDQLRAPSIRDITAAPLLESWAIGKRLEPALVGHVSGHPHIETGPVVSSGLYYLDPVAGYARTLSRWYRLGTPIELSGRR